ncbi:MAG: cupredoxin domain-containing protein [bacterium]
MNLVWVRRVTSVALVAALLAIAPRPALAGEVSVTVVNVETAQGVKMWIPSTIVAKKGDTVKLKLVNKLSIDHGYQIPAYGVEKIVPPDGPNGTAEVSFTADKAGIFPIQCQLHPAHVGGQLVVLE